MKSQITAIVLTLGLVAPTLAVGSGLQRGPDRPDEAFTVHVISSLEDEEDTKYKAKKVKEEVEKRIKSQKRWFIVAKNPEKAEIRLEIVRHTMNEQVRHKLVARVDATGAGKHWVTETWAQERHDIEVRVDVFGIQKLLKGEDARESGGSLKRAAEDLARNLETFCRENYEELSTLRRTQP